MFLIIKSESAEDWFVFTAMAVSFEEMAFVMIFLVVWQEDIMAIKEQKKQNPVRYFMNRCWLGNYLSDPCMPESPRTSYRIIQLLYQIKFSPFCPGNYYLCNAVTGMNNL